MNKYHPIIGLEIHVELKTLSKMFCGCKNDPFFAKSPNIYTCPVCLGMPGGLPLPNQKAIDWTIKLGLALNCEIPLFSKFDRKNYFYPDLAKGYQISQYDQPFCVNGFILINGKKIRIRRVHLEEDTGKLIHASVENHKVTLIDFNRSGVPLVEIVTEPDLHNGEEAKLFLKKLQQIVRYLGISDADMEKGSMRLEPNISLSQTEDLPNYKVEVKNINSFRFAEKAINFEIDRQTVILNEGKVPVQETRGWYEAKNSTVSQRIKEEAADYRYFPEPDIPPFNFTPEYLDGLKQTLPELPQFKIIRFRKDYGLNEYDAEILTDTIRISEYFEECVKVTKIDKKLSLISPKHIANWLINRKIDLDIILPAQLISDIYETQNQLSLSGGDLEKIIKEVISENSKATTDYKNGKEQALMFLYGQIMKKAKTKLSMETVKEIISKNI